jgi:hypothetical protein
MITPSDVKVFQAKQGLFSGDNGPWLDHLVNDEGMCFSDAREVLSKFESIPFIENGRHLGTLIKRNAEVHFALSRDFRGKGFINASRIKRFFKPILDESGFLVTKIGAEEDDLFVRRIGFEQVGACDTHKIFMLTDIKLLEK